MPCLTMRKRQQQLLETARYSAMKEQYISFIGLCWDTEELCEKIKDLLWDQYCNKRRGQTQMVDYIDFQIAAIQSQIDTIKLRQLGNLPIPPETPKG